MVERGGIAVDWFEDAGTGAGQELEMENEVQSGGGEGEGWRRTREEEQEEEEVDRSRKRRRAKEEAEQPDDGGNNEDEMLELRLSLAVAISVPSPNQRQSAPPGSFVLHHQRAQQSHSHLHHQQQQPQLTVGHNQSPLNKLQQRPSSPLDDIHDKVASRANLTASLKHLATQQQPFKVKVVQQRMPGGEAGTTRQPPHFGASSIPQLPRPLVRASSSPHVLQEGQEPRALVGRIASSTHASTASLALAGQRAQADHLDPPAPQSTLPKGLLQQQSQPRPSGHRAYSRSASPGISRQSSHESTQQGHAVVSSTRIFTTIPYPSHIIASCQAPPNLPITGAQVQAFLQHHTSSAVSVASHRQAYPPSHSGVTALGKNPSAFSVVRPSVLGIIPPNVGDASTRDRAGDSHVVVNVCDRKVKLTSEFDTTSLYALCRRWVRNDVPRKDQQSVLRDCPPLPRPLPVMEASRNDSESKDHREAPTTFTKIESTGQVGDLESCSEKEVLQQHVEHFKKVRKRFRDERMQRIARFMPRLALLLPVNAENNRRDGLSDQSHL